MTTRLPELSDDELVLLYRAWSEETYAAGFMRLPRDGTVPSSFINWVKIQRRRQWTDYEQDLIERWRMAETKEGP